MLAGGTEMRGAATGAAATEEAPAGELLPGAGAAQPAASNASIKAPSGRAAVFMAYFNFMLFFNRA